MSFFRSGGLRPRRGKNEKSAYQINYIKNFLLKQKKSFIQGKLHLNPLFLSESLFMQTFRTEFGGLVVGLPCSSTVLVKINSSYEIKSHFVMNLHVEWWNSPQLNRHKKKTTTNNSYTNAQE